jgi:hypothetical protein
MGFLYKSEETVNSMLSMTIKFYYSEKLNTF